MASQESKQLYLEALKQANLDSEHYTCKPFRNHGGKSCDLHVIVHSDSQQPEALIKVFLPSSFTTIDLHERIDFQRAMAEGGVKSPKILGDVFEAEGQRAVVMEFLEAKPIKGQELTHQDLRKIAQTVVSFHKTGTEIAESLGLCDKKFKFEKAFRKELQSISQRLANNPSRMVRELDYLSKMLMIGASVKLSSKLKLNEKNLRKTFQHRDLNLDNILIDDNAAYLVDFEYVAYGYRIDDISRLLITIYDNKKSPEANRENAAIVLNEIHQKIPFTKDEMNSIKKIVKKYQKLSHVAEKRSVTLGVSFSRTVETQKSIKNILDADVDYASLLKTPALEALPHTQKAVKSKTSLRR